MCQSLLTETAKREAPRLRQSAAFTIARRLPDEAAKAIAFVLNDTPNCDDAASAQAVAFARNIDVRSVTLNGDMYEPGGTMPGGAVPSESGVLVRAQELRAAEERVEDARRILEALEREEAKGRATREAWRARTYELEIWRHELRMLHVQVRSSNAGASFLI